MKPRTVEAHSQAVSIFCRYCILFELASDNWDGTGVTLQQCCMYWERLIDEHEAASQLGINGKDACNWNGDGRDAIYYKRILV